LNLFPRQNSRGYIQARHSRSNDRRSDRFPQLIRCGLIELRSVKTTRTETFPRRPVAASLKPEVNTGDADGCATFPRLNSRSHIEGALSPRIHSEIKQELDAERQRQQKAASQS